MFTNRKEESKMRKLKFRTAPIGYIFSISNQSVIDVVSTDCTKTITYVTTSNDDYCSEKSLDYLPELGYCFTDEQGNTYKISDMVKYPF